MLTAGLAALGAGLYGVADFLGGLASRRTAALVATIGCQAVGFAALALVTVFAPPASWSDPRLLWGVVAGVSGGMGVLSLYAGLAAGRMSIVAPITAALAASIPALVGIVHGERLTATGWVGIALALAAVIVVSLTSEPEEGAGHAPRLALLFAVAAGVGFAGAILSYAQTPASASVAPLLVARATTLLVLGAIALARSVDVRAVRSGGIVIVVAGLADAAANTAQVVALRIGPVSVAAVIGALYPAVTVVLARYFLAERMRGWQRVGIAMALVAVVLTAWPA